jgi:ATP-dependent Zn protease
VLDFGQVFTKRPAKEVCLIMDRAYQHAKTLLQRYNDKLIQLATALLKAKRLNQRQVQDILGPRPFDERFLI